MFFFVKIIISSLSVCVCVSLFLVDRGTTRDNMNLFELWRLIFRIYLSYFLQYSWINMHNIYLLYEFYLCKKFYFLNLAGLCGFILVLLQCFFGLYLRDEWDVAGNWVKHIKKVINIFFADFRILEAWIYEYNYYLLITHKTYHCSRKKTSYARVCVLML